MTAFPVWSDQHRALAYACSMLGEAMSMNPADGTVSSILARNRTVVLAASTSLATAITHVIAVHPQVGSIQTKG